MQSTLTEGSIPGRGAWIKVGPNRFVFTLENRAPLHAHWWPSVLHVLDAGEFRNYDDTGRVLFDSRTASPTLTYPMTRWMAPQAPHSVETLGDRPIHRELRQGGHLVRQVFARHS